MCIMEEIELASLMTYRTYITVITQTKVNTQ